MEKRTVFDGLWSGGTKYATLFLSGIFIFGALVLFRTFDADILLENSTAGGLALCIPTGAGLVALIYNAYKDSKQDE